MLTIPGYDEALASERRDRALAFLGQKERIAGIECNMLTPRLMEWLRALENPYIIGGEVKPAMMLQFLWIVSTEFQRGDKDEFIARVAVMDGNLIAEGIEAYIDRMFLDSPDGKPSKPLFSYAAGLAHEMAREPYRWDVERTLETPLPIIFQLIKAKDKYEGGVVVNKKSDRIIGDWLDEINARGKEANHGN